MELLTQILYLLQQIVYLIASVEDLFARLRHYKFREPIGFQIPKKPRRSPQQRQGKWSSSYRNDPRNRELQHRLIGLLRGDIATAKRLLKQQRQLHKGKSDNWYLEKVIYDLERDRH